MSVYVDAMKPCLPNAAWPYRQACHLFADELVDLHDFAGSLSLRRDWFQQKRLDHYDLTEGKRKQAVARGAVEAPRQELVWRMKPPKAGKVAALTVQQPFADLLAREGRPDGDLPLFCPYSQMPPKRVENRRWETTHRGPLLIHAGKSRERLGDAGDQQEDWGSFTFGAFVAMGFLVACLETDHAGGLLGWPGHLHWLKDHPYVEGPYCFVLVGVRRFPQPIPRKGSQGLFYVPSSILPRGFTG